MKREIKFRAWIPTGAGTGDMVQPSTLQEMIYSKSNTFPMVMLKHIDFMQYTNLRDKNGREIYEGDIVDIGLKNQDGKLVLAPVIYGEYIAGYVLDNGGNGIWQRLTKDCKVIGNIYEDQNLLEAQHD